MQKSIKVLHKQIFLTSSFTESQDLLTVLLEELSGMINNVAGGWLIMEGVTISALLGIAVQELSSLATDLFSFLSSKIQQGTV